MADRCHGPTESLDRRAGYVVMSISVQKSVCISPSIQIMRQEGENGKTITMMEIVTIRSGSCRK